MQLSQKIVNDLSDLGFKDTQGWTLAQAIEALQESGLEKFRQDNEKIRDEMDIKLEKWYYKILVSFGGIVAGAATLIIAILK